MNSNLKRIEELEKRIRASAECPLWIDGHNNVVRVDLVGGKRGQPVEFPTTHEAARWLEGQIDNHPGASGTFDADRLWELYPDADKLHGVITDILGDRVIDFYGLKYSKDEFPGAHFGMMKTTQPADINLWLLQTPLRYFGSKEFKPRWQAQQFTDEDNRLLLACFALFAWKREGSETELWDGFSRLFFQVTRL